MCDEAFEEEEILDYRMVPTYARQLKPKILEELAKDLPPRSDLPEQADSWLPVPNIWRKKITADEYSLQVQAMLVCMSELLEKGVTNHLADRVDATVFRQARQTAVGLNELSIAQKHPEVLTVPYQICPAYSVYEAKDMRTMYEEQGQFCLGTFALGMLVLRDPTILEDNSVGRLTCLSDNLTSSDRRFKEAPCFSVSKQTGAVIYRQIRLPYSIFQPVVSFLPMHPDRCCS